MWFITKDIGTIRLESFVILDVQRDGEIITRVLAYVPSELTTIFATMIDWDKDKQREQAQDHER
jgi:hypothetical protein